MDRIGDRAMSPTEKLIAELITRKQEIDDTTAAGGSFVSNHRWLLDAVEVLLASELDLREQLRNAGLLR
jgi:hypothetical protein